MKKELFAINVPQLYNPFDRDAILCAIETLVINAYRLAEAVDASCEDDYNPTDMYEKSYDELIELIGGYNYNIDENSLDIPRIWLVIDEYKTELLGNDCEYPVYMVVYPAMTI